MVGLILLFVFLGWQALEVVGWIALGLFVLFVLIPAALFAVGAFILRRRMRRNLRRLQDALEQHAMAVQAAQREQSRRRDAIDVEGEVKKE